MTAVGLSGRELCAMSQAAWRSLNAHLIGGRLPLFVFLRNHLSAKSGHLPKGVPNVSNGPRAEIHLPVLLSASKSIRAMPRSGFFFRRRWEGVSINTTSSVGRTVPARR
jgi:hypothetical protein